MSQPTHRVLFVGANPTDLQTITKILQASLVERFDVASAGTISAALERLAATAIDVVLLDWQAQDRPPLEALEALRRGAPTIPVLVIGTHADDEIEALARQAGACDCLLTDRLDTYWLPRAIRYAIRPQPPEEALVTEVERVGTTLGQIGTSLIMTDVSGHLIYLNRMAEELTGWSRAEAVGRRLRQVLQVIRSSTRERVALPFDDGLPLEPMPAPSSDCVLLRRDGSEVAIEHTATALHDHHDRISGARIVLRDVSAIRAVVARMSHLASHDALTDLPNRSLLADRLARSLALAARSQRRVAVLFLDIDRFKSINDTLGHLLGDALLRGVGATIAACVRSSDTVSRYGGDEFVVVLAELLHAEDATKGAEKILTAIARPHTVPGHQLHITASMGISVYPDDGTDPETLLTRADMALYHAKDEGRDGYRFFEPGLNLRAIERQSIEDGLRGALARHEFELLYQPKIQLKTNTIVGAEALLRWRRQEGALVEPATFVSIAEDCGLIGLIGDWVIREVCRQARAWNEAGFRPIPVSVNISAVEFRNRDLLKQIIDALQANALDASQLEIELTESVLMTDAAATDTILTGLRTLGVRLAIDDFGTGWSGLSYLRRFPIDALKIDTSFVQAVTTDPKAALIVSAMIRLGKGLTHRVIAAGVETREQLMFLQAEGCDEGQGYFFSRPLAAADIGRLLGPRPTGSGDIGSSGPWISYQEATPSAHAETTADETD